MRNPFPGAESEKQWAVESERTLSENPYFRLLERKVRLPDGRPTTYFSIDYLKLAVGVVPRRRGEILLIRQYRFLVDQFAWAIPSGGVEKDEDMGAAALRELKEETGYDAARIERLHAYFPSYGSGNQEFHLHQAWIESDAPVAFDRNEVIEVRWFTQPQVKEMLLKEQILDGLSLTPLLFLASSEKW